MTDLETRVWRSLVGLTTRLPAAVDSRLQRVAGVTHFEYRVLSVLAQQRGCRLQLSMLAAQTDASLSRLSHVLSKMERQRWATRSPSPGGRSVDALLTEAGHRQLVDATPIYLDIAQTLVFDGIDYSQLRSVLQLTEALLAHLYTTERGQP